MTGGEYNKFWMRGLRGKKREEALTAEGRCIHCEIILRLAPNHDCTKYDWLILDA